ncbi:MAG: flavoprotein [Sulfuricurvum sp. GWF2_44_89]|uniref:NAD(P)/FAD-dependent oxidoreductase n=1 Tax=Sulfuricurvum sp. RIFOXYD2_FULL_44_160 TaxID=1802249 RepID=UPI0008B0655F|nr:NAD(P)/FAD-dependent oxidoreductase [Sulfuricurvum sp. RIFOXYD2_FULL_44_160]OHD77974.1 MAG: flavoprotein [Sulfuricurvum sp. GWF2_44_89]OHD93080.1 MAG: flavoprotein [Sulfuricurvum sp. RIFOXYD2_FULL_44_160]
MIVVGAGAAGLIAAITAARRGNTVLLLEKLSKIGSKLKATGGGRCNLTNTLSNEEFMARFGREGRFMTPALSAFDHKALIAFFAELGVESHAPDGYRVFPISHSSLSIITALEEEMARLDITLITDSRVERLEHNGEHVCGVSTADQSFYASNVIIATGGLGYPQLGAEGDGFAIASDVGHKVSELFPAMMPLRTRETWVAECRADTIPKVDIRVDLPKAKNIRASGDLIFTQNGIRGPVVLDISRDITPLIEKFGSVPLLINMTKGMNEEQILSHIKKEIDRNPEQSVLTHIMTLLPESLSRALCTLADADPQKGFNRLEGSVRDRLLKLLAWTPLTIIGHDGFKMAMITRGGVSLKEIRPESMESKILSGLYFCGEVMNLDGPCGGYNLQWSFASGYVAGHLGVPIL